MRVLITSQPASGHWNPMVGLALELRRAGHDVQVASSRRFLPEIQRFGLDGVGAGSDWLESEAAAAFPALDVLPPAHQTVYFLREIFMTATVGPMVDDLMQLIRSWRPDVIVSETYEFSGSLAAELTDVPFVLFAVGARLPPRDFAALAGGALDHSRAALGLAPDPDGRRRFRDLCLSPMPPRWIGDPTPPIPTERFIRHTVPPAVGAQPSPAWLRERRRDRPLVYATLGTVFNRTPGLLDLLVEALADGEWDAVVTTGGAAAPARLPDNVRVERYLPHRSILPACDLVVCHGGFNTVMDALATGLPVVALPLAADQPFQAARVTALGLGTVPSAALAPTPLGVPAVDPALLTPALLADAIRATLDDDTIASTIADFRRELMRCPGPEQAVALIEACVSQRAGGVRVAPEPMTSSSRER